MSIECELLPCPFCGGTNIDPAGWSSYGTSGPVCDDCGGSTGDVTQTPEGNIAVWNTRHSKSGAIEREPASQAEEGAVTQADRDAATSVAPYNRRWCNLVLAGHMDGDTIVQAFARHRIAAIAKYTGAGRVDGWQPIATAPKDGTKFDVWVPDAFGGYRMTGLSFDRRGRLRPARLLTAAELPRRPTHWQPLPTPPELAQGTSAFGQDPQGLEVQPAGPVTK